MPKKDTDLPRRYPDARVHDHTAGVNGHTKCGTPPGWEPAIRQFTVACVTPGCRVEGVSETLTAAINADGIVRILCGACSEWHETYTEVV